MMKVTSRGKKVKITALREGDEKAPRTVVWWPWVYENLWGGGCYSKGERGVKDTLNYYNSSNEKLILAIRLAEGDKLIGICGFDNIIWTNATAYLFIGIGDKEFRNKGFGKEALNLLLDYAFNEMNFYKLQLNVIEYNRPAIKLYEKVGFIREGLYREYIYRDGTRYHMFLYGILKPSGREMINYT